MNNYKKGAIVKGQVSGIAKYGIFVNIDQYVSGLIHISEISNGFVRDVNDYVNVDETIFAKIIDIDEENSQLKLSIKDIDFKVKRKGRKAKETPSGFKPLEENLDKWIKEKLEEIE